MISLRCVGGSLDGRQRSDDGDKFLHNPGGVRRRNEFSNDLIPSVNMEAYLKKELITNDGLQYFYVLDGLSDSEAVTLISSNLES